MSMQSRRYQAQAATEFQVNSATMLLEKYFNKKVVTNKTAKPNNTRIIKLRFKIHKLYDSYLLF